MNQLNRYFTPFSALLILSAVFFSEPDPTPKWLSMGIWGLSLVVNWWLAANTYRFVGWAGRLKALQIWINFIWAVPLFVLLGQFWAPMWLLFALAPVTAAVNGGRTQTWLTTAVSTGTMLLLYRLRGFQAAQEWGAALSHATFIVVISLFIHSMAETELRLRDR